MLYLMIFSILYFLSSASPIQEKQADTAFEMKGPRSPVQAMVFVPKSELLAAASAVIADRGRLEDCEITLWDLTKRQVAFRLTDPCGPPTALSASRDGKLIAAGCLVGDVVLWDIKKRRKYFDIKNEFIAVSAIRFNRSCDVLLAGDCRGSIKEFSVAERKLTRTFPSKDGVVRAIDVSPDESMVVAVYSELQKIETGRSIVCIWQRKPKIRLVAEINMPAIAHVSFISNKTLVVGSYAGAIQIISTAGKVLESATVGGEVLLIEPLSEKAFVVATRATRGTLKLHRFKGNLANVVTAALGAEAMPVTAFSPEHNMVANGGGRRTRSGGVEGRIRVFPE